MRAYTDKHYHGQKNLFSKLKEEVHGVHEAEK